MDSASLEEIKRHFNVSTEALRSEFRAVAEAGAQGDELRREFAGVRSEIEEVKAMIRLSYAETKQPVAARFVGAALVAARSR